MAQVQIDYFWNLTSRSCNTDSTCSLASGSGVRIPLSQTSLKPLSQSPIPARQRRESWEAEFSCHTRNFSRSSLLCVFWNANSQAILQPLTTQKILAPIKIKLAHPPPKKKTPKTRNFMDTEVLSCRKNQKIPGAHKFGGAISGPRIAGEKFDGHEVF